MSLSPPFPLWPDGAPGARGQRPADQPGLTLFRPAPERDTGASMLILPGGGYAKLAEHEGAGYADWLSARGITCAVLQYRLGSDGYRHPAMLQDASRGLRYLRKIARDEGRDIARIGVMGSSAGGHLAATLATGFTAGDPTAGDRVERESSRPDLAVLCYPVITLDAHAHRGSCLNLLGDPPDPRLGRELSVENRVTPETPPCFIWHTEADAAVPVENALLLAGALRRAGVSFALHIFPHGRHGLGLGTAAEPAPPWPDLCLGWLREQSFVP
jgi:acetyl esterase/lipase